MKKILYTFILLSLINLSLTAGGRSETDQTKSGSSQRQKEVVVYTYDSFVSDWGAGPEITKRFEQKTGLKLSLVSVGDGAQILSRAILEKNDPQADVLLGIDNNQTDAARKAKILSAYKPSGAEEIPSELLLTSDYILTPFDWSYFALIYDTQSKVPAPKSLEDLTRPEYSKKLILMDPRMSTPGLGFAAWTIAVFKDKYLDFWKQLKPSILTMAPGWDAGYGLFTHGEAPLVVSYTTSPAYHVEYDKTDRYKALIFSEGHIMQIEGAGVVKGAQNEQGAKAFMDFLISKDAQSIIPLTQWMYPVNKNTVLPDCYKAAPQADKKLSVDSASLGAAVEKIMAAVQ
ncbi:thiamine ABC transporter substrate-binding protein [Treponema parvum]|uniref:Thiamine ABC transporter substrate-binding protein n=1 Tax=Treponema parvum TaxID=138851 RepID=A0A975F0M1_9SPIR|nr:thiamine ABC transporter substrate-binding protein [Treponema parvum]QTQ12168.1 thiamine ABC transporter substrate-binding protein [Treponema parvum]